MPIWLLRTDPVGGNIAIFSRKPYVTSATSNTLGTGSKTFTVPNGSDIAVGDFLQIETVGPAFQIMIGQVTAFTPGGANATLVVNVTRFTGTGTWASWRMVDMTPLFTPGTLASMQRLHWTSAFEAVSTTPALTQQVSFTIPAMTQGQAYDNVFPLFAHGQSQPCEVEGRLVDFPTAGSFVSLSGSVPVWMQTESGSNNGFGTFVELGCTATHVVAIVKALVNHYGTVPGAMTLTIDASVNNFGTDAVLPTGNPALPIAKYVPNSYLQLGRGRIDTRRRYASKVDSGHRYAISKSATLTIVGSGNTAAHDAGDPANSSRAQNELGWRWRYECDGFMRETQRGWNGTATNGGTATADVVRVKT